MNDPEYEEWLAEARRLKAAADKARADIEDYVRSLPAKDRQAYRDWLRGKGFYKNHPAPS